MSTFHFGNRRFKSNTDTGFSNIASGNTWRFMNRNGTYNVYREGVALLDRVSIYRKLLQLSSVRFWMIILFCLLMINTIFTTIYFATGTDDFTGFITHTGFGKLRELFYFSFQTFTTVGYGRINPTGDFVNIMASVEAVCGFLSFAFITGLMYGRFSRPRANLLFSKIAVVAPFKEETALMFRFAASKNEHTLSDLVISVNLGILVPENGVPQYRFVTLPLERTRLDNLPMNLTVVHPINEDSPLYGMNASDFEKADVEIYVSVQAFDDVYSATVQQRTSYIFSEIKHGLKFSPMFRESNNEHYSILEMQKLNTVVPA